MFPFFDIFFMYVLHFIILSQSIAYEVDDFEPNHTLMLWCEHFVVPLFLPSSCPVYRSATEYNS